MYEDLLKNAAKQTKQPMIFKLPGCTDGGETVLANGAFLTMGAYLRHFGENKAAVLISRSLLYSEAGEMIRQVLQENIAELAVYHDVPPEPTFEDVEKCRRFFARHAYALVIGIGGGSVMDMAKLMAFDAEGELSAHIRSRIFKAKRTKLILCPSTAGTGSEISPYAVMTLDHKKVFFRSDAFLPDLALIDPLLTCSLPPKITVSSAFDAMTHALEGAMSAPGPYTEALAAESAGLILDNVQNAVEENKATKARYSLSLASLMGMMAYVMGGGLYAHSISYILTLQKRLPHGVGCGMALPYTLLLNYPHNAALLRKCCFRCGCSVDKEEDVKQLPEKIRHTFTGLGMPASLRALGYTEKDMSPLAKTLKESYDRPLNPVSLSEKQAEKMMQAMLDGNLKEMQKV